MNWHDVRQEELKMMCFYIWVTRRMLLLRVHRTRSEFLGIHGALSFGYKESKGSGR